MPYDSAATKSRLLDAAFAEFVERGLAGARVDRIAEAAAANKQAIYAYFGSKEGLFEAVLAARLGILADAVPFTADDLPGYAVAMFDYLIANPGVLRLTMWKQLERGGAGPEEVSVYAQKVAALEAAHRFAPGTGGPIDLVLLILGMASAWSHTEPELHALGGGDAAAQVRRHRAAVRAGVAAMVAAFTARSA